MLIFTQLDEVIYYFPAKQAFKYKVCKLRPLFAFDR